MSPKQGRKMRKGQRIKATQHCTSKSCPYTHSHTAAFCNQIQPRRCGCAYCYPKGEDGE